jgi:hypothetical protein
MLDEGQPQPPVLDLSMLISDADSVSATDRALVRDVVDELNLNDDTLTDRYLLEE